jgi:hypothetical protein
MRRIAGVLAAGVLLLASAGCGDDGGGDEAAFCDELEALSDDIADGALAEEDGLEEAVDRANALIEVADEGEQTDAVEEVGEALSEADPDDAEDTAEVVQDELGDIAEDTCDIDGDEFAIGPEATTTTTEPDDTTTTEGAETTTTAGEGRSGPEVNARQPVPADLEQEDDFPALAQACFDGDPAACDRLFLDTPVGSVAEDYGRSCGGRVAEGAANQCAELITGPDPIPADVTDPNAQACFDGDMAACDAQFNAAANGSPDQLYGGLCGGRVSNTTAFCVDVFGAQAFL